MLAVFTHDRYHHCKFCLDWLLSRVNLRGPHRATVYVFDDQSTDPDVRAYLLEQSDNGRIQLEHTNTQLEAHTSETRGWKLALARRLAAERFVAEGQYDFLLTLDNDIILGRETLQEAVDDFQMLQSTQFANPGALALHALVSHHALRFLGRQLWAELVISGEANCLFSRGALVSAGIHYAPVTGGFADVQFSALRKAGFRYYTRVDPYYQVQHLGIGTGGSAIYREGDPKPFWLDRLYCRIRMDGSGSDERIHVDGFDAELYERIAGTFGGAVAPKIYQEQKA